MFIAQLGTVYDRPRLRASFQVACGVSANPLLRQPVHLRMTISYTRPDMPTHPQISTDELLAGVRSHLGASRDVRVHKRTPFRIPKGGTGSYFERVDLEVDHRRLQAVLKLGLMTGPPTREALFFGKYSADSPMRTPRCYGVGQFSSDVDAWVLMERMPRGKRLGEWTLAETRDALRNLEGVVQVVGREFGDQMQTMFERDFARCEELTLAVWRRRAVADRLQPTPWPRRAARWLSGKVYAQRLQKVVRARPASPARHAAVAAQVEFIRERLAASNLFALLWNRET